MRTVDVLQKLGFEPQLEGWPDTWVFDFGSFKLKASQGINRYFRESFFLAGNYRTSRIMGSIEFEMPLDVDSFEQGVAWIAHGIGNVGSLTDHVPWVSKGREWEDSLPWRARAKAHDARPKCFVDREWFRLVRKQLREIGEQAAEEESDEAIQITFDGEVLRLSTQAKLWVMPATGNAWDRPYHLALYQFAHLPKRSMSQLVMFSVWEGTMEIAGMSCRLLDEDTSA